MDWSHFFTWLLQAFILLMFFVFTYLVGTAVVSAVRDRDSRR